jgi:8-oxo-dGTP pyrophosphatase MutT (NUDIX family)
MAAALAAAALRELAEETGLRLARPGAWPGPALPDWSAFAGRGLLPDAGALSYIFRAITPPGRTRRFDARFFMAATAALADDPDDFSGASGELANLSWVPLARARELDLPFITTIVIAEAAALVAAGGPPASVPFFDNSGPIPVFRRIG